MAKPKGKVKAKGKLKEKAKARVKVKAKGKVKSKGKGTVRRHGTVKGKGQGKPTAKVTTLPPAAEVYTAQVADILRERPRTSTYRPVTVLNLALARVRAPTSVDQLAPAERAQLEVIWHPMPLDQVLSNEEYGVEVAEVVDGLGTLRHRATGIQVGRDLRHRLRTRQYRIAHLLRHAQRIGTHVAAVDGDLRPLDQDGLLCMGRSQQYGQHGTSAKTDGKAFHV